nr:MAG TPA: PROTEIN/RNA Complex, archaeal, ribosomal, 50S, protein.0A [Caudoviricetes sp.]
MDDYISREAALEQCKRHGDYTAWSIEDGIEAIPAADVEPVRQVVPVSCGIDEYYGEWVRCPNCDFDLNTSAAKFCGGCGAKMDLEDETNDD